MAVGLSHGGYATTTEDLSSGNPVLPGSVWVIPEGPRTEGTAGPYPPGAGKLQGKSLSPRPPLRAWETIALPRACFPGTPNNDTTNHDPKSMRTFLDIYLFKTESVFCGFG